MICAKALHWVTRKMTSKIDIHSTHFCTKAFHRSMFGCIFSSRCTKVSLKTKVVSCSQYPGGWRVTVLMPSLTAVVNRCVPPIQRLPTTASACLYCIRAACRSGRNHNRRSRQRWGWTWSYSWRWRCCCT